MPRLSKTPSAKASARRVSLLRGPLSASDTARAGARSRVHVARPHGEFDKRSVHLSSGCATAVNCRLCVGRMARFSGASTRVGGDRTVPASAVTDARAVDLREGDLGLGNTGFDVIRTAQPPLVQDGALTVRLLAYEIGTYLVRLA